MAHSSISPPRAALTRVVAGSAATLLTFVVGGAGVIAVYYPLRHAAFPFQWLLLFVLMLGESAAIHLPSEVILPVGGWLVVRQHHLGIPGVLLVSAVGALGNTAGSGALYLAGRHGGRPLVRRFGRYVLLHESDIDRAATRFGRRSATAIFVSRLLPVVRTYIGFPAGVFRVPASSFLLATFAGSLVWSLAFVSLGAILGSRWDVLERPTEVAGMAMGAALVAGLVAVTARQLLRARAGSPI